MPSQSLSIQSEQLGLPAGPSVPGEGFGVPPLQGRDRAGRSPLAQGSDRLDLARWLVSAEHPLTSRVAVNRFWQMLFGAGLVRTTEDFGAQGEWPSHPELLDWLAVEFRGQEGGDRRQEEERQRTEDRGQEASLPKSEIQNPKSSAWDTKRLLRLLVTSAT